MKFDERCSIVQDLLPNYIENLLAPETQKYVEKHLSECENCKEVLHDMKENFQITKEKNIEDKQINFMKKFKRKMKTLTITLLIIIFIFAIILARRIIIITSLSNKAKQLKQNNDNNYYVKTEGVFDGYYKINECYVKDNNVITKAISYSEESGRQEIIFYKDENNELALIKNNEDILYKKDMPVIEIPILPYYVSTLENICRALVYGVESTQINNIQCYVLKNNNSYQYIDKATGLLVREMNFVNNQITDYHYEFGIVQDQDFNLAEFSSVE